MKRLARSPVCCWRWLILWLALGTPSLGQVPVGDGDSALRDLIAAHEQVNACALDLRRAPSASSEGQRLVRVTVSSDRRFSYEEFLSGKGSAQSDWLLSPYYFVFFDGHALSASRPPSRVYEQAIPKPGYTSGFGPTQLAFAPWPCVESWGRGILASTDRAYARTQEGWWTVASAATGLTLTWAGDHRLIEIRRPLGQAGGFHAMRFAEFTPGDLLPRPKAATEVIHVMRGGAWTDVSTPFLIEGMLLNPADAESRLAFDPAKRGFPRLDSATQNVVDADGRVLYNMKQLEADANRALGGSQSRRSWLYAAIALGVAVSILIAFRLLKRG